MTPTPARAPVVTNSSPPELPSDRELLRRYAQAQDEPAFRELVERHIDLVYSAARRRLGGDTHNAADVAQQVFTALARQAARFSGDVMLPAWLYATTRHLSANWVRAEQNRRARERTAHRMNEINTEARPDEAWARLQPLLDAAIDELPERDRGIILLRFLSRRSYAEIGAALDLTEDAARMRVERALEKLRATFIRRGVVSTITALGGILTENATTAAPAGMAAVVTSAAVQGVGASAGILAFMTSMKFGLGLAASLVVVGVAGLASLPHSTRFASIQSPSASDPAAPSRDRDHVTRSPQAVPPAIVRSDASGPKSSRAESATISLASRNEEANNLANEVVERRVALLDALVHLTPEQRRRAAALFANEQAILDQIPPEERGEQGRPARLATRSEVRAMLTDEQRRKYDISPQTLGGGLPVDPVNLVARLDQVVALTSQQKQKAAEIFWDDIMDQIAALPADQALPGFMWRDPVRARLRQLLSPAQQATFDQMAPYRKNR